MAEPEFTPEQDEFEFCVLLSMTNYSKSVDFQSVLT